MKLKLLKRPPSEAIFYSNGTFYTGVQLLAKSVLLARHLRSCAAVINLADNRLEFVIGFLAALIANKTTILPANNKRETIQALMDECPDAVLVVSSRVTWIAAQCVISATTEASDTASEDADEGQDFCLDADFIAVTVYTSGSTGTPKANNKTWLALVHTAEKLFLQFEHLGAIHAGSYLMGTVPSQHMYGLEMLVMLPLVSPVVGLVERGLLPDYLIDTALSAPQPVVLISSPIHVAALLEQCQDWSCFAAVISATAPLDTALAEGIEHQHLLGVWEIYGCTEAGSMATRRTSQGAAWQFLPGITPVLDVEPNAVDINHLNARIALQDQIELHEDGRFTLGPRNSDLIKIAGKRSSLAHITALIRQHPLLTDAYVFASTSKYTRLYALVVGSVNSEELKRFLAQNIDDVFVPRIIRYVAQLPRNTNGKIIHSEVLTLWNSLSAEKLLAPVSKATKPNLQSIRTVQIPLSHPVFEAHFPGQPLVPAALLLMWIEQWLMEVQLKITAVKTCKFLHPVLPGDTLALVYHQPHTNRLTLKLMKADLIVLEGQFSLEGCYVE